MDIAFWHWLILGVALIAAEMLVPGTWLLWPGLAALATGLLAAALPGLGWEVEALAFTIMTGLAVLVGRRLYARLQTATDHPLLNRRGEQAVGTLHTLETPIENGSGRMRLGDTTWKIAGPDLPAGTRIRVTGIDGIVLLVEKVE